MKASAAMKQEPTPSEASPRPTPFASAPKSEFIWPVPPEELARVVFDNKDLERKVTAHSAGEEIIQKLRPAARPGNEGRQQNGGCRRCCWSLVSKYLIWACGPFTIGVVPMIRPLTRACCPPVQSSIRSST